MRIAVLSGVPAGSKAKVISITAGKGKVRRLMEMGILPGEILEVISNSVGPVIVRVRGSMVAIGRGMASNILVEVIGNESRLHHSDSGTS